MPRQKQPVDLIVLNGRSHLGKAEIEQRRKDELVAPADKVRAPGYLSSEQKREFKKIADQLIALRIMGNLDCDALARFLIAKSNYCKFTDLVDGIPAELMYLEALKGASLLQDRAFKQCRQAAGDLGLTITSRCRLVVPKPEEKKPSKFDRLGGSG